MKKFPITVMLVIFLFWVNSCHRMSPSPEVVIETDPTPILNTPTATATLPPLAVVVNGAPVYLSDYQDEVLRLSMAEATTGKPLSPDERKKRVLDNLISLEILSQEAVKNGFKLNQEQLDERILELIKEIGGEEKYKTWLDSYNYDEESLKRFLWKEVAANYQKDILFKNIPDTAEQIHARQILVISEETGNQILRRLASGTDFESIAREYDPLTGGDLGWFPREYLTQPDVEKAAFEIKPGETSQLIKTSFGYHIIQVIEKENARMLDPEVVETLQHKALKDWIAEAVKNSSIQIMVND